MNIQMIDIGGLTGLAEFDSNGDHIAVDTAFIVGGQVRVYRSHFKTTDTSEAIKRMRMVYADGGMEVIGKEKPYLAWSPSESREFCNLPISPDPWDQDMALALCMLNAEPYELLGRPIDRWYLTQTQRAVLNSYCTGWNAENQAYLDNKAVEFAQWWVDKVGKLGSSGDGMADILHIIAMGRNIRFERSDLITLKSALYDWAKQQLERGIVPRLHVDYQPDGMFQKILSKHNISHIGDALPWKTSHSINFDDRPQ